VRRGPVDQDLICGFKNGSKWLLILRILSKGKKVLRSMHEADLGRLQPKPERKKRVASRRMDKPSEEPTVDME
jgi:hypothetical protein